MNAPIMLTPAQIITLFLGACVAVTTVAAAVAVIANLIGKLRAPNQAQDKMLAEHAKMLDNDNKRLVKLQQESALTMKALLALLSHGIDGNDIDKMKKARDEINNYLIDR